MCCYFSVDQAERETKTACDRWVCWCVLWIGVSCRLPSLCMGEVLVFSYEKWNRFAGRRVSESFDTHMQQWARRSRLSDCATLLVCFPTPPPAVQHFSGLLKRCWYLTVGSCHLYAFHTLHLCFLSSFYEYSVKTSTQQQESPTC